MERLTDPQTWYVVLDRSHEGRGWWKPFLHKQFQHVILYCDMGGFIIQYNPLSHATAIMKHEISMEALLLHEVQRGVTAILSYTVYYGAIYKRAYIEPYTCVSAAKRLLGIRSRLFTPKALYHELIRAGALVIKPYCIT